MKSTYQLNHQILSPGFIKRNLSKAVILLVLLISSLTIGSSRLIAITDSVDHPITEVTAFIGHLNFDCNQDTIICKRVASIFWMPKLIIWGGPDTNQCARLFPDSVIVDTTFIEYPDSTINYYCSYFIDYINQDSVFDLVFRLKWTEQDTIVKTRFLCLFGQDSLWQIDTLRIHEIDTIQNSPFVAREMIVSRGLDSFKIHKSLWYVSYQRNVIEIYFNQNQNGILSNVQDETEIHNAEDVKISIQPNPATDELLVKLKCNQSEQYKLKIIDINGKVISEEYLNPISNTDYMIKINLTEFQSGTYSLIFDNQLNHKIEKFIKIK